MKTFSSRWKAAPADRQTPIPHAMKRFLTAHRLNRLPRNPDIAGRVGKVALTQSMWFVSGRRQNAVTASFGPLFSAVRINSLTPEFKSDLTQRAITRHRIQRAGMVGMVRVKHPFMALISQNGKVGIAVENLQQQNFGQEARNRLNLRNQQIYAQAGQ